MMYRNDNNPSISKWQSEDMKKTTTIAVWLVAAMCLASTAARPQETANSGVDVDDIFQQAVNNAGGGGGLPSIPGFEGGFPSNLGATENVQTPEFVSGHGSENVAEPDAETIGSQSPFFPEEENKEEWPSLSSPSHHELSPMIVPINEASPLPTEEVPLTSELLNHEISPTDSGQETMPPFDGTSNADLSSLSPFNFNPVQNFPAFGGSQTNHSQSLITGRKI